MAFFYTVLIENALRETLQTQSVSSPRLYAALQDAVLNGGKRLRPNLVMLSADLYDIAHEQSLSIAIAAELIHCYSLIHDDLPAMDDDDLRRGKPTLHKAYDEATAILVGDALQARAFELIASNSSIPADIRCDLIMALSHAAGAAGMVGGQMLDIMAETSLEAQTLESITLLQAQKTGALICFAAKAGAILAEDQQGKTLLNDYGAALGLCFQLTDDILDQESSAESMGKATQKDDAANKATFVRLLGLQGAKQLAQSKADDAITALETLEKQHQPANKQAFDALRQLPQRIVTRKS
ncbi:MAG: polyprenyl synthetase family protein [Alphaproteobacteria bacterium]